MIDLSNASDETITEKEARALRKALAATSCSLSEYIDQAEEELAKINIQTRKILLKSGQKVIVTLSRKDGAGEKKWTHTLKAEPSGEFVGNWGVAILPNQDEEYFTKDNGEGGFAITEKGSDGGVDLIPSVFYTYMPAYDPDKPLNWGPTLGLGLDQENLSLFAGGHLTYRTGLGITAGVAVHKQERLLGEFTAGQV